MQAPCRHSSPHPTPNPAHRRIPETQSTQAGLHTPGKTPRLAPTRQTAHPRAAAYQYRYPAPLAPAPSGRTSRSTPAIPAHSAPAAGLRAEGKPPLRQSRQSAREQPLNLQTPARGLRSPALRRRSRPPSQLPCAVPVTHCK